MKAPRIAILAGVAAAQMLLASCGGDEAPGGAQDTDTADTPSAQDSTMEASLADHFGTTWRLVRIQSMDDTVTTPDDRSKYTLTLDANGEVSVLADCNRGRGTFEWSGDARLEFGPLATTRAMCPPGSISDRFLQELSYVRSYVLRDGMLHLATMADGSILDFEPLPEE